MTRLLFCTFLASRLTIMSLNYTSDCKINKITYVNIVLREMEKKFLCNQMGFVLKFGYGKLLKHNVNYISSF